MATDDERLFDSSRVKDLADFVGLLGSGVMPTRLYVLEQHQRLLFLKFYDYSAKPTRKHEAIYRLLVRFGEVPDAPGSIQVWCIWGVGTSSREIWRYDHMGLTKGAMTPEGLKARVMDWWRAP